MRSKFFSVALLLICALTEAAEVFRGVSISEVVVRIFGTFLLVLGLLFVQESPALGVDESVLEVPIKVHNGETVKLKDLVGKRPIYLKFWASWCVPCRAQMPHLEKVYQDYNDDLEVISVNIWINETEQALSATRDEFGLTVPIAIDKDGALAQAFDFVGTPYHILIDHQGDIVHKGYRADTELDRKIELLAARENPDLPAIALTPTASEDVNIVDASEGVSVLLFTATWCDWYLKESRPSMSNACIQAQRNMNQIHEQLPDVALLGVASRLWTGENDLQEYIEKYEVSHPFKIDETNSAFLALEITTFPTMVVMNNGKEVLRTSDLESAKDVTAMIRRLDP